MNTPEKIFKKLAQSRKKILCKGEVLFQQSDAIQYIYVVKRGKIKLARCTIDGNSVVLQLAVAGEILAEASLFSDHYHCIASVYSQTAELFCFDRNELISNLRESSDATMAILKLFASQIRRQRTILEIRNIRSAKQRIYTYFQLESNGEHEVELQMHYKDTAYQLGLAHETFYRAMKQLENENKIVKKNYSILIS